MLVMNLSLSVDMPWGSFLYPHGVYRISVRAGEVYVWIGEPALIKIIIKTGRRIERRMRASASEEGANGRQSI